MCSSRPSWEPRILRRTMRTAIFASTASQSFSVLSLEPDRTRPPETVATQLTCDDAAAASTTRGRPTDAARPNARAPRTPPPRLVRVPFQSQEAAALAGERPHLERGILGAGNRALAREGRDAQDLRRRRRSVDDAPAADRRDAAERSRAPDAAAARRPHALPRSGGSGPPRRATTP